jgi:hypothetical protein
LRIADCGFRIADFGLRIDGIATLYQYNGPFDTEAHDRPFDAEAHDRQNSLNLKSNFKNLKFPST